MINVASGNTHLMSLLKMLFPRNLVEKSKRVHHYAEINQLYNEVRANHSTFICTCILRIMTINARNFYRDVMKTQANKIARLLNRDIDVDEHLLNISLYKLTFFEKLVLCRGLKFSLPQFLQPIGVKASFEKLY